MQHRRFALILPLLVAALALGCAGRPTITLMAGAPTPAAPAPGVAGPWPPPPAPPPPAAPEPTPVAVVEPAKEPEAAPAPVAPPPPQEFAAVADLTEIHFDFDQAEVRRGDAVILDANVEWLKDNPGFAVLIEGHADERGTLEYNLALSERRAKATTDYLVARGLPASRITLISYGKERPLCTDKNEECWAENRRAAFLVKPD